ncbi:MAG: hypothetical protein RLO17_11210 [Cyclobacteriaceae bacterium]|tara:strand:+ start:263 stop:526 length:264 start_codon:yes stop_codon:yes gene_type:complete
MKIEVQDFVPEKAKGGLFKSGKIQPFEEVVEEMNGWLASNSHVNVLNVETVVLPNIHEEEGSRDTELYTAGESHSQWYQLIRVWYTL